MINLEFVSSPDQEIIGPRSYHKNMIYLGHKSGDILIQDPDIFDNHLIIEVNEHGIFLHPHPHIDHFHLNGKRTYGVIALKLGDQITIGKTCFILRQAEKSEIFYRKELLNKGLERVIQDKDPISEVLSFLEERIKSN